MKKINLGQKEIIHFVGIGGIGMSGLAQIMKNMGFKIQGSDQNRNKNTASCLKAGIKIFIGHSKKNVKNSTIVVRSSAIKNNNSEHIAQATKVKKPNKVLKKTIKSIKNFTLKKMIGGHCRLSLKFLYEKVLDFFS